MAFNIESLKLYVILDLDYCEKRIFNIARQVIQAGVKTIQFRANSKPDKELFAICKRLKEITTKNKVNFIVNDRVDICLGVEADGVHLGQQDLPVSVVRKLIGRKIIGLSTHNIKQIHDAEQSEVNYISVGPIFKSFTKPNLPEIGVEILDKVSSKINKPLIAIGGINTNNIDKLYGKNLTGIAVISGILLKNNIKLATKELMSKVDKLIR